MIAQIDVGQAVLVENLDSRVCEVAQLLNSQVGLRDPVDDAWIAKNASNCSAFIREYSVGLATPLLCYLGCCHTSSVAFPALVLSLLHSSL